MDRLIETRQAAQLPPQGYWQSMDSLRDKQVLEEALGQGPRAVESLGAEKASAMIIVDTALRRARAAEGRPDPRRPGRRGLPGQRHRAARSSALVPGHARSSAIANRTVEPARRRLRGAASTPVHCGTPRRDSRPPSPPASRWSPRTPMALAQADGVDVVVEVTGSIEYAARVVLAAIEAGKHVVQMNAELDGTVGPILKRQGRRGGRDLHLLDGDQPGVQMNLYRFVAGLGVQAGAVRQHQGPARPLPQPDARRRASPRSGARSPPWSPPSPTAPRSPSSRRSSPTAPASRVARRGMLGPDFSGGDPTRRWCRWRQTVCGLRRGSSTTSGPGIVDYVVGARPGPGVFVLGTHRRPAPAALPQPLQARRGAATTASHTPYHLCHFEVPTSVARAVLFGDAVLDAGGRRPQVGVIARRQEGPRARRR